MAVLLDTHVWAWSLVTPDRLSAEAATAIRESTTVAISAITFYEIGQKVRLGKWPGMEPFVDGLRALADRQDLRIVDVNAKVAERAAAFDWLHRDPFDRLIAATAIQASRALVTTDRAFATLTGAPLDIVWT